MLMTDDIDTTFWSIIPRSNDQDLFNALGALYASVLFVGIQNSLMVQPVVDVERTVFYREKAAGMYSSLPYTLGQVTVSFQRCCSKLPANLFLRAQVAIEILHIFFQTVTCGSMIYGMIDFEWTATKFLWFIFFFFTSNLYFTLYGMMVVAFTPNSNISAVVSTAFYGLWSTFSGFVIPRGVSRPRLSLFVLQFIYHSLVFQRIPIWWRWYYWACPVSWSLYGLVASQYGGYEDRMEDTDETVKDFLLRYFGYTEDFVLFSAIASIGFNVLFALVFAYCIKLLNFQKR